LAPPDTYEFLEHCHALGAAGIQAPLTGDMAKIRARAEQLGVYIEAMVPMPESGDTSAFVAALDRAKQTGATALRSACLHTRRYETFTSLRSRSSARHWPRAASNAPKRGLCLR
jgi:hypothetical protein